MPDWFAAVAQIPRYGSSMAEMWTRWLAVLAKLPGIDLAHAEAWTRFLAAGVLLLLGGLCQPSRCLYFLVTVCLVGVTTYAADMLLHTAVGPAWIATAAVGLAYLIHAAGWAATPSIRGVFGWFVIVIACVASAQGWLDWQALGQLLGDRAAAFFEKWSNEWSWGTVLVLTAVGVSSSRSRPIHFFNACLLAALAYYCLHDGYVREIPFPTLAKGDVIPTQPDFGLHNIELWRWVLIGELGLLSVILLHQALGVGALTLAFAVAWIAVGLKVDAHYGRDAMLAYSSAASLNAQSNHHGAMGPADSISIVPGDPSERSERPALGPEQKRSFLVRAQTRLGVILGWVYLTALLAGFIGAGALRLMLDDRRWRLAMAFVLWFAFGIGAGWLWSQWPAAANWEGRLSAWVVPDQHIYAIMLVALGVAALAGSWALREGSRYETWLYATATAIFVGTALTLIAVALLIRFGGFPSLPPWSYVVVAGGQSSMMWVLLMHRNLRGHRRRAPLPA